MLLYKSFDAESIDGNAGVSDDEDSVSNSANIASSITSLERAFGTTITALISFTPFSTLTTMSRFSNSGAVNESL